ncbi:MAG: hypothetical protein V4507_16845 [Verrucomicrobiota bacterium]
MNRNLISATLLAFIFSLTALFSGATNLVWLCPSDPTNTDRPGAADYMQLFTPANDSLWVNARIRVNVFKLYPGFINRSSDDTLQKIFNYLKSKNIALAVEWPALSVLNGKGGGLEGFLDNGPTVTDATFRRIKNLGGTVAYVTMDEPLYFGHYYTGDHQVNASIVDLANNVALNLQKIISIFPNVVIGDVEPVDILPKDTLNSKMQQWLTAYQNSMHRPIAFLHVDFQWSDQWREDVVTISNLLALNNSIDLGVIFNSALSVGTSREWIENAEGNIQRFKFLGVNISHPVFQNWNSLPALNLPESQTSSYISLVNYYFSEASVQPPLTPFRRLYNPIFNRHVYSSNSAEITTFRSQGWKDEGSVGWIYPTALGTTNLVPLYRLYSPSQNDYFYTTNVQESSAADLNGGYNSPLIACYVYASTGKGTPLYRAYNKQIGHFYTSNLNEYNGLPETWKEGISCYLP